MSDSGRAGLALGHRGHWRAAILGLLALLAGIAALVFAPEKAQAHAWACNIYGPGGYQFCEGHAQLAASNRVQVRAVSGGRWPYSWITRYITGAFAGPFGPFSDDLWHTAAVSSSPDHRPMIDNGSTSWGYYYTNHWLQGSGFAESGFGERASLGTGALEFPVGVTYPEAVRAIFIAESTGRDPMGTRRVAALPEGKVILQPVDSSEAITVDLSAPYGYNPATGAPSAPTVAQSSDLSPEQAKAAWQNLPAGALWPKDSWVDVPILPDCMVIADRSRPGPTCGPSDMPTIDFNRLHGPRLG